MMKRFTSLRLAVAVFAVFALFAAACSSDSTDTTAAGGATDTTAAGGATDTTAAAASADGGETKTTPAPEGNDIESAIVKEMQTTLAAVGYDPGPVDGIYGWGTITALEAFQTDAGITVDGKYGPETHKALEEAAADSGYDWDKQAAISEMQQEMADLGYYNGAIDGEYGPETEAAIKAVQADCGTPQDGIYGPDTHSCLLDLGGDA